MGGAFLSAIGQGQSAGIKKAEAAKGGPLVVGDKFQGPFGTSTVTRVAGGIPSSPAMNATRRTAAEARAPSNKTTGGSGIIATKKLLGV